MKKKTLSLALALVMCLSLLPCTAFAANSTTSFTNSDTHFRTSYREDEYLDFAISGNKLTVSGKLPIEGLQEMEVNLREPTDWSKMERRVDENGEEYYVAPEDPYYVSDYFKATGGKLFSKEIELKFTQSHILSLAYTCGKGMLYYSDANFEDDSQPFEMPQPVSYSTIFQNLVIEKAGSGYRFKQSLILGDNLAFAREAVDSGSFRGSVSDAVKKLSDQIVGSETSDYAKLFLLHKWVAENIYYDYDYYLHNSGDIVYKADEVLNSRRTVCEGYANLLNALIRAQGIPSMHCTTKALGLGTGGGSFALKTDYNFSDDDAEHAHVEAWADGRWVVMDPTWDSNNRYEYGKFETSAPVRYTYFDITPEAFALDHWYVSRADGQITMKDGKLVNKAAGKPAEQPAQPTQPANTVTATPTASSVLVNGETARFDAYNIKGNNYFKLRDLAQVLRGSEKQFEVTWDGEKNAINLISGTAYTSVGGELAQGDGTAKNATPTTSAIYKDGMKIELTAYNIGGNNYFKLRDLGIAFDFDVSWDGFRNTITIETAKSYTAD